MLLGLLIFPTLVILTGLALIALAPAPERYAFVLPAVRTVALIITAAILVAALWSHP